jgi:hypothetical protein
MSLRPAWAKLARPYLKNKRARGMAEAVDCSEALASIPSTREVGKGRIMKLFSTI